MLLFSDVLYMFVRYVSPSVPMCLRCLMLTLSGPVELLFLLCFIAAWTCVVVSDMLVVCSFSVFLLMCLFDLCLTVLVNILKLFHQNIVSTSSFVGLQQCHFSPVQEDQ